MDQAPTFTRMMIPRVLFWAALVLAVVMALLPHPPHTPLDSFGDKVEHSLAFLTMSFLGAAGYSRMPLVRLGERLSFLGALIEVFQSIPALHRDCDVLDWLTDTAAIIVALTAVTLWRRSRARRAPFTRPRQAQPEAG